ncbi:MAG: hypothetical protein LBO80_04930 [Treponema sp.]|jgi:hypothetical protein|nr:hypothetical protein [Treponema sp.]
MISATAISLGLAAAGAASGVLGLFQNAKRQKKSLEDQRAAALGRLADSEREARNAFERSKYEALRNAARADQALDRRASQLETAFNAFTGDYNYAQEAQSRENQAARMGAGESFGAAYSDLGYSGVRAGSSNYQALAQREDLYEQQFALALEGQRREGESQLRDAFASFGNSLYEVSSGRGDAEYLRGSFQQGGSQFGAYQDQMLTLENERKRIKASAETALENAAPGPLDYITAVFGGGAAGFQTGAYIGGALDDYRTPKPQYPTTLGSRKIGYPAPRFPS